MSEQRISKLEESFASMQLSFWKIESALENIDKNLTSVLSVKEEVITHREKFKVTENRLINIEADLKKQGEAIASINLRIALVTWAWGVVIFLINHFLTR
jgi:chromosome segregation ATPase